MSRYDRQIKLTDVGPDGQAKLRNAKVLIVGVGGLGCPAAMYLAGAGVGKIGLMDHDKVDMSNLHRQVLFQETDVGRPKAVVAKERLEKQNSDVAFEVYEEPLTIENAENIIKQYDIVLDGTDNFETKYLINDACILTDKPWVFASIYKNEGQLSVFNYKNGPTYRCVFPKSTRQNISCEATGVLGVLPGILGTLQAAEVLKIILGAGEVLTGKLKLINMMQGSEQTININKRPEEIEKIRKHGIAPVYIDCDLKNKEQWYLDVREVFEQPKPKGKKVLSIPMGDLTSRYQEIPNNQEVFVFCQSGKRSKNAIEILKNEFGFHNLKNVEGGIETIIDG
ncbi:HesA/MoeB/ThiF family protein [Flagellimonas zhangzhouensis]|uniref:Molybdopterin-synthase adenylyltransferase n=1 Tax=Flagellimonas zhangzhouensis TaxID=1073328 RepID=A0A1H2S5V9_9FLAO|nr:HesA/MoeB/ThiF family protein [Allomuricauda zhangzhouensis]SDQ71011.1 adenylyltransferase and sulfurtransferase [Allomuricauda zhangzhouensis]SDW26968.1 adenylyltransferase and sulfurtransferase [Allomuricauda zhangzhouensis]